jgi:hypothetical protein
MTDKDPQQKPMQNLYTFHFGYSGMGGSYATILPCIFPSRIVSKGPYERRERVVDE